MTVYFAMEQASLEKYAGFRELESRLRSELSVELIQTIKSSAREVYPENNPEPLYSVENGVAKIRVEGTLEPRRSVSASLYGNTTTYAEIAEAVRQADADALVNSIDLLIDSPGGKWDGADMAAEAVKQAAKPTRAVIGSMAASAAYLIASQADKIYAETKAGMAGSIGVAAEYYDRTKADADEGLRRLVFTNTASADKRPALETDEGAKVFIEQLDDMYQVMEDRITEGRDGAGLFMRDNIRGLKGRVVTAKKALDLGLIDGILSEKADKTALNIANSNKSAEGVNMKLEEFLSSNAEAKAEFDALIDKKAAAAAEAMAKESICVSLEAERKRISEILTLSGVKIAEDTKAAVESGADAGTYAKTRLSTLNGMGSNVSALGNPSPETNNFSSLKLANQTSKDVITESGLKSIARNIRGAA